MAPGNKATAKMVAYLVGLASMLNRLPIGLGKRRNNDALHRNLLGGGHKQQPASHRGPHDGNSGERLSTQHAHSAQPHPTRSPPPTPRSGAHAGRRTWCPCAHAGTQCRQVCRGGRQAGGHAAVDEETRRGRRLCGRSTTRRRPQVPQPRAGSQGSRPPHAPAAPPPAAAARAPRPQRSLGHAARTPPDGTAATVAAAAAAVVGTDAACSCWSATDGRGTPANSGRPTHAPSRGPAQLQKRLLGRRMAGAAPQEPCSVTVFVVCWYVHIDPSRDGSVRLCARSRPGTTMNAFSQR